MALPKGRVPHIQIRLRSLGTLHILRIRILLGRARASRQGYERSRMGAECCNRLLCDRIVEWLDLLLSQLWGSRWCPGVLVGLPRLCHPRYPGECLILQHWMTRSNHAQASLCCRSLVVGIHS